MLRVEQKCLSLRGIKRGLCLCSVFSPGIWPFPIITKAYKWFCLSPRSDPEHNKVVLHYEWWKLNISKCGTAQTQIEPSHIISSLSPGIYKVLSGTKWSDSFYRTWSCLRDLSINTCWYVESATSFFSYKCCNATKYTHINCIDQCILNASTCWYK